MELVSYMEEAVENEVTHGDILVTEGAFDSTSFDIIMEAAEWLGLGDMICWWIRYMLGNNKIKATLAGETLERSVVKCCLQGGISSRMLWSLVVDELTEGLGENG
jgi:hypothetical protein